MNFLFVKMRVRHLFCLPHNVILLQYNAADTQVSIVFFHKKLCFFIYGFSWAAREAYFNDYGIFDFVDGAFKCVDINFRLRVVEQWGKFILLDIA